MADLIELHLIGRGYSGKAVRVRTLSPTKVDKVAVDAAKIASANAVDYRLTQVHIGVCRCLVSVTRGPIQMTMQPTVINGQAVTNEDGTPRLTLQPDMAWLANDANWERVDPIAIELDGGYEKYISNPKDDAALGLWWSQVHEVSPGDVDRIVGKARTVSTG